MINRRFLQFSIVIFLLAVVSLAAGILAKGDAEAGEPLPTCGQTNSGWESGDLTGWTQGTVTDEISVVGIESVGGGQYTLGPLEGAKMARLGANRSSSGENQPEGPNELSQTFTVTNPKLRCAYYFWTYDYFGFDEVTVRVSRVSDDGTIYYTRTGAFGPSGNTTLKGTGWRVVNVDLNNYMGQQVKVEFTLSGTLDSLYGSWVYIDSASSITPPSVVDTTSVMVDGEPPMFDPATGQVIIPQSPGDTSLMISAPVLCPNGDKPDSVTATLKQSPASQFAAPTIEISLVNTSDDIWSGTFTLPSNQPDTTIWDIFFTLDCPADGTVVVGIGSVILIDPSGYVRDSVTHQPIEGATVRLQRYDNGQWHDVDPLEIVNNSPTISPQINPLLTNSEGHYAWDVAEGKYRVIVSKEGYITQTSGEVDIPPPVTDLDIDLVPVGGATPTPTSNPTSTPPPGQQLKWGDVNCSDAVDPVDALLILRDDSGLSTNTGSCPALGTSLDLFLATVRIWGDFDCSGGQPDPIDALKTLRHDAGQSYGKSDPTCPSAGASVTTSTATPTPAPTATPTPGPTMVPITTDCPGGAGFPIDIPDYDEVGGPNGVTVHFSPSSGSVISNLDVCVNIDHTYVGDIFVELEHVDTGTTVVLIDQPGVPDSFYGCDGFDIRAFLDDSASSPVEDECAMTTPTIDGAFRPNEPLSAFNGEMFSGDWEAHIIDVAGDADEVGSLVGMTIYNH